MFLLMKSNRNRVASRREEKKDGFAAAAVAAMKIFIYSTNPWQLLKRPETEPRRVDDVSSFFFWNWKDAFFGRRVFKKNVTVLFTNTHINECVRLA